MRSAKEITQALENLPCEHRDTCCEDCIGYCFPAAAIIRAAQIEAMEWMREEAAKAAEDHRSYSFGGINGRRAACAAAIRAIKLPSAPEGGENE